jgi:hypothetical protein
MRGLNPWQNQIRAILLIVNSLDPVAPANWWKAHLAELRLLFEAFLGC